MLMLDYDIPYTYACPSLSYSHTLITVWSQYYLSSWTFFGIGKHVSEVTRHHEIVIAGKSNSILTIYCLYNRVTTSVQVQSIF